MSISGVPFRKVALAPVDIVREDRDDGSTVLRSTLPLQSYPKRLSEKLIHWAEHTPDKVFMAQRGGDGNWCTLTYGAALTKVRSIGQALLERGLSSERTVAILSENSLEHLLLALAAVHVGIPYAPISPPYSLLSSDFGKLRHCLGLMTPGLVFVSDGKLYERALRATVGSDVEIVVGHNPPEGLRTTAFADLMNVAPSRAVDQAFEHITPDTVAKVLFTSGSTGQPKGVIITQRMWCANLQQITQTLPLLAEDPLFVDWLPWSHTFGGNHNTGLTLYNGGSLYIDHGRATPQGIEKTVANLRELAPTVYFNVPKGFEELIPWLREDTALRQKFFSRLKLLFYAGAGMPQPVWDALEELATQTVGERIPIITGLGMTESGPSAMFAHWAGGFSGLLGVPVAGLELKLAPNQDKLEARYRGPNVTPGYWRQPEATAAAFDEEGFFRTGDALKFVDAHNPNQGMLFDGRVAEDFKLTTGTWVNVGILRANLVAAGAPLLQDAVITGHDRDYVGAILFLNVGQCRVVIGNSEGLTDAEVLAHPTVRGAVQETLSKLAQQSTGSSNRIVWATIAQTPASIDLGEITDKGSLNQRNILKHRIALVEELYADPPSERTIGAQP